ncbi:catalase-related peroxidase [Sporosarcina sp. NCCP-2716]|uniref:catalase n=1 Tax=Sporosarcina sp. NCCP-2716 TaxID=2943679 RepID=UPI00203A86CC|nr:catalase [Sporosarcina sp. NCCP-2716]GKV70038.1 catalase-related peroxidase [Sporosarcina sp. NCCP-2716]
MESNPVSKSPSPEEAVTIIEDIAGRHPGFRRAHAKGIGLHAQFTPNGNAEPFTEAAFLRGGTAEVIVRFSHSAPMPDQSERLVPIKGMAVQFSNPSGEPVSLVMANAPIFPTKTPEAFMRLIQVLGRRDIPFKERLGILKDDTELHTVPALLKQLKTPSSFAMTQFWALHAYILSTEQGTRQPARFTWIPARTEWTLPFATGDMELDLLERMADGPVQFRLLMTLAALDDPTDDPSAAWPDERPVIDVGVLTLQERRTDNAEDVKFDPTVEVPGFSCSDDPVLHYRAPVYAESFRRRTAEREDG